jgi:hypothetical protein
MATRLKVGVDVPWVTSWSEEEFLGVQPCASVDGRLAIGQADRPGRGKPQYSKNHLRRQRVSVAQMLCPMCGKPTESGDRWMQTARYVAAGVLRARGLGALTPVEAPDDLVMMNAGSISPSHLACAERALQHCPYLGGLEARELLPFPESWVIYPLFVEARAPAPHALLARQPPSVAAVSFLQLCGVTNDTDPAWRERLA